MSSNSKPQPPTLALLIVGDAGVGKTSLRFRYCDNNYTAAHTPTISADAKLKATTINEHKLNLKVWDGSVKDGFHTVSQSQIKTLNGIIIAYAVNDRKTFESVKEWMAKILENDPSIPKILVGTKIDLFGRMVSIQEGQRLADSYDIQFYETSAKDDVDVTFAFNEIAAEMYEKLMKKKLGQDNEFNSEQKSDNIKGLVPVKKTNKKSSCWC